jgi:hypothetical protein
MKRHDVLMRRSHVQAVKGHPGSAIGLAKVPSSRQWFGTVEGANVVQAEKTSFEDTVAALVLTVYPPESMKCLSGTQIESAKPYQVKFKSNFWKTRSRNPRSSVPWSFRSILKTLNVALVNALVICHPQVRINESLPCVYWRVDVTKVPLVGWDLAIRLHVPFAREQVQLLLCEGRINHC